ncbi:MAG: isochorismate synthase [Acidimicrobiia bacterium]|nr:MAG: isochorismate synthase [Acidimicrobiia bacterium]
MLLSERILRTLAAGISDASGGGLRRVEVELDLDPFDLVRSGASAFGFAACFSSPEGRAIGALGVARRFSASGHGRFGAIDADIVGLERDLPVLIGFSFDEAGPAAVEWEGFGAATAVVPEVAVIGDGGRTRLVLVLAPGSDGQAVLGQLATMPRVEAPRSRPDDTPPQMEERPPPSEYLGEVDEAVAAIRAGAMRKVVLARSVTVKRSLPIDPFDLAARLRDLHPSCRVFAWQEGEGAFVGASPELLVERRGETFHLSPLAGSARRDPDAGRDRRLGEALLASDKDRWEHEIVVEDAMARLEPLVTTLHRSPSPRLERFGSVQHLATPIGGTTSSRLLELAGALHPTAAVGGYPRNEAVAFIAKIEGFDRGWYTGGVGWADSGGDGELAIALRCALVRGDRVTAFAGSGIVAESEPAAELEETRLKLAPIVEVLS